METFLLISAGAFVGANVRFVVSGWAANRFGTGFPIGTLIVNLAGCFAIGLFLGILTSRFDDDPEARLLVATGFLGAETTFSTFAYESVTLLRGGHYGPALRYVLGSTVLGLAGTAVGLALADLVTGGAW
ncbi:MAG TPA: fluoride efflux transporter CrcB [Thermomicrobiales bacterium]|nr:fluoride efflux transporter CrcB [Thermomicrobiales bacterium]